MQRQILADGILRAGQGSAFLHRRARAVRSKATPLRTIRCAGANSAAADVPPPRRSSATGRASIKSHLPRYPAPPAQPRRCGRSETEWVLRSGCIAPTDRKAVLSGHHRPAGCLSQFYAPPACRVSVTVPLQSGADQLADPIVIHYGYKISSTRYKQGRMLTASCRVGNRAAYVRCHAAHCTAAQQPPLRRTTLVR